ncbi:MAG TPA: LytTR family DNA-binding domain-containing protein [Kofleriaceae bacterium]|nr:LytTR family DNA-binding domain-containing protein [Kofleriaceae bacterium]
MTPIRVAIIDDEPLARAALRVVLAADPEVEVVGDCIGVDAPALIERAQARLVFLDVQMPELDGFGVLDALRPEALPAVVFVTAYDAHAVRAFDVHAVDYVLKPFDDARVLTALARAKQRLARGAPERPDAGAGDPLLALLNQADRAPGALSRFLVRTRGKIVAVRCEDIDWIEATDYYATLHVGGTTHLMRQTMAELETRLDPRRFVRVHRGAIVNLDRIREIHPLFRGDCTLVLADGTQVKLSRTRRAEFERLFGTPR